jgi:hypothetical protein
MDNEALRRMALERIEKNKNVVEMLYRGAVLNHLLGAARLLILEERNGIYHCIEIKKYDFNDITSSKEMANILNDAFKKKGEVCGYRYKHIWVSDEYIRLDYTNAGIVKYDHSNNNTDVTSVINKYRKEYPELFFTAFNRYDQQRGERTNNLHEALLALAKKGNDIKGYIMLDTELNKPKLKMPISWFSEEGGADPRYLSKEGWFYELRKNCLDKRNWRYVPDDKLGRTGEYAGKTILLDSNKVPIEYEGEYDYYVNGIHRNGEGQKIGNKYFGNAIGILLLVFVCPFIAVTSPVAAVILAVISLGVCFANKTITRPSIGVADLMYKAGWNELSLDERNRFIYYIDQLNERDKKLLLTSDMVVTG